MFALQVRLVTLIHVKFGMAQWYADPLGRAKFHLNRCKEMGTRSRNVEINFHFL